jgi:hypothetical protein
MDPLPRLCLSSTIDTQRALVEIPHARASDMAMHVVTNSSHSVLAAGIRARPYTFPRTACCAPRKPLGPPVPAAEPTLFVGAHGDACTLARVSPAIFRNSSACDYGPSRPCTG